MFFAVTEEKGDGVLLACHPFRIAVMKIVRFHNDL